MSTLRNKDLLNSALKAIDDEFRDKLIKHYLDLKIALAESRYDKVGLDSGKFCEVILRFLQKRVSGSFTPFGKHLSNFPELCRNIITSSSTACSDSLKKIVPRALVFIFSVRSSRGVGHVAGEVDNNYIDAVTIARVSDWIICDLIREYTQLAIEDAQDIVDSLSVRHMPKVWHVDGKFRVMDTSLNAKDKVLILCHQTPTYSILIEDLQEWIEYSRKDHFKDRVLSPLHKGRLIEFCRESDSVTISPLGVKKVEEELLKN